MSRWFEDYGCDGVRDGLIVGAMPRDAEDVAVLSGHGVTRVVNLAGNDEYDGEEYSDAASAYGALRIVQARVPSEDFGHLSIGQLDRATALTTEALKEGRTVYLHCRAGWQRSVVTAAATISRLDGEEPLDALRTVMALRRGADPLPHQITDLLRWWATRSG